MTTKPYSPNPKPSLTIGWLYPTLMSTYGDRGNIIVLQKIGQAAGLDITIKRLEVESDTSEIYECDLLFMGGAQDLQQEIVNKDLLDNKGETLKQMIENETPGLYICGAYQFLGKYYKDAYGTTIEGLGIFDMYTQNYKTKPRLTGNIVIKPTTYPLKPIPYLIGFENHGGRTFLKHKEQAFAKIIKGFGNNGEDATEGISYKNSIGTYLHGPILPSNPELAIVLLKKAYEKKYEKKLETNFDDKLSKRAKEIILNRLKIF